jgi:hypothetical protein
MLKLKTTKGEREREREREKRKDSAIRLSSGVGLHAEFKDVCLFRSRKDVRGLSWFVTSKGSAILDQ